MPLVMYIKLQHYLSLFTIFFSGFDAFSKNYFHNALTLLVQSEHSTNSLKMSQELTEASIVFSKQNYILYIEQTCLV